MALTGIAVKEEYGRALSCLEVGNLLSLDLDRA
jgi:hypothetical protein